ncbi:EamA family transporter [Chloroflexota bacterium]
MSGEIIAIAAMVFFSMAQIVARRGSYRSSESYSVTLASVIIGLVLFLIILPLTDGFESLASLSLRNVIILSMAGIIHYVLMRYCMFTSIRLIGANTAVSINKLSIPLAVTFGIIFLNEEATFQIVVGGLAITIGAIIIGTTRINLKRISDSDTIKGTLFALLASILIAISGSLVRVAMKETVSPFTGAFVSYSAAFIVVCAILAISKHQRYQLLNQNKHSLALLGVVGLFLLIGQVLRYTALIDIPLSVVQPILGSGVLFVFIVSLLINRKIDVFNIWIFSSILLLVTGIVLVFL